MKIKVVESYSDFLEAREIWEEALSRSDHTIFSTWEWLSTWWKYWGNGRRLLILIAEHDGKVLGIATLMRSTYKMMGLQIAKIEFIGTPNSDYHDFLLTDKKQECIDLFVNYLKNLDTAWDCLDLVDFPENAQYLPLLSKSLKKNLTQFHDCPFMGLPKTYELLINGLSRNQRKNIYRSGRRLKEMFEVEFVDYSQLESFPEGMRFLFDLHQKRWQSRGLPGIFADRKVRDFNFEVSKKLFQRKWLSLFLLRLSGKPVSAAYGFKYRSKFCEYATGFEPSYNKYNVGNLLRAHMINQFIQEGLTEFDFMRGAEEYKERWNTSIRWNRRAIITRKGFPSAFRNWLCNQYTYQVRKAKHFLRLC